MSKLNRQSIRLALTGVIVSACIAANSSAENETNAPPALTLREAATLTLARNPSLLAYGFDLQAADARRLQAGVRPNPALTIEVEDVIRGSEVESNTTRLEREYEDRARGIVRLESIDKLVTLRLRCAAV